MALTPRVVVLGAGARLEDAVVDDTARLACDETSSCFSGRGVAHGLGALGTSTVNIARALLQTSDVCGLWLSDGDDLEGEAAQLAGTPQVDATDTLVADNAIGLCVQSEGLDLSRVSGPTVRFQDNAVDFETTDLPRPRPAEPAAPIDDLD